MAHRRTLNTAKAVLFDLDGTLIDTAGDLIAATHAACAALGVATPPGVDLQPAVAEGSYGLIRALLPEADAATVAAARAHLLTHYAARIADHSAPYPGISALLVKLKARGTRCAVATNKPHALALALWSALGLDLPVQGVDDAHPPKPNPRMILALLERLDVAASDAVYVGDDARDAQAARAAGVAAVVVGYGYGLDADRARLVDADAVALSVTELAQILGAGNVDG